MSLLYHPKTWEALVTTPEATRAGFISIAFEKNIKGNPFIEEAKSLKIIAAKLKSPMDVLSLEDIYPALLTASGLSEKAQGHLLEMDKKRAITELVEKFLIPSGKNFVDELVFRYLLTKGDALGGIMRNLAGSIGERKLIRSLLASLALMGIRFNYLQKGSKTWLNGNHTNSSIVENLSALSWQYKRKNRVLLLNITPPFLSKNVDLILLNGNYSEFEKETDKSIHKNPEKYIALGELKGGIDPAGADEHWKTANSALERIRAVFDKNKLKPFTFFIGAAIEKSMAKEIFDQLQLKRLSNAANLTVDHQLVSICNWLCKL